MQTGVLKVPRLKTPNIFTQKYKAIIRGYTVIVMMPYFSMQVVSCLEKIDLQYVSIFNHTSYQIFYDKLCLTPCLNFDHSIFTVHPRLEVDLVLF